MAHIGFGAFFLASPFLWCQSEAHDMGFEGAQEALIATLVSLDPSCSYALRVRRAHVPPSSLTSVAPEFSAFAEPLALNSIDAVRPLNVEGLYWRMLGMVENNQVEDGWAFEHVWDVRQRPPSEYVQETSDRTAPFAGIYNGPAFGLQLSIRNKQLSLVPHSKALTVWGLDRVLRPLPIGRGEEKRLRAARWEQWSGEYGVRGFRIYDSDGGGSILIVMDDEGSCPREAFVVSAENKITVASRYAYRTAGCEIDKLESASTVLLGEASAIIYEISGLERYSRNDSVTLGVPSGSRLFDFRAAATADLGVEEATWPEVVREVIDMSAPLKLQQNTTHSHGPEQEDSNPRAMLRLVGMVVVSLGVLGLIARKYTR